MIAIIDYGMGNVSSIINMFRKIGVSAILTNDKNKIREADKLVLPGVGAFDTGMLRLSNHGLIEVINEFALDQCKPVLGICLGMQMLGRKSEEGISNGLGLIPFDNKRFSFSTNNQLKIPHMGWDIIESYHKEDPLLHNVFETQRYYFVHSYHAVCDNEEYVLMRCNYGYSFAAAVKKGNIFGVQFHPEKSHIFGMTLLENFARRV